MAMKWNSLMWRTKIENEWNKGLYGPISVTVMCHLWFRFRRTNIIRFQAQLASNFFRCYHM